MKLFQKFGTNQKGITGLETAIILIAFVMVASVLSYVVLSAGLFSSQKAKEARKELQESGILYYKRSNRPWKDYQKNSIEK